MYFPIGNPYVENSRRPDIYSKKKKKLFVGLYVCRFVDLSVFRNCQVFCYNFEIFFSENL